ncbi:hypothetical protein U7230_12155 [Carboxydochorda subterranea]|uniref:Tetratricopeptide repeat protein n=1 Tax=Carboxydichorda subterranea TaxID=3109565 RepID=A0ABZ1BW45_9FIRM|nr:hypothetical protein [Limnochorda sp. L945t]WRP16830.1 hypothetical protein U7230_12155 [Limnochorda sp. L945t]
MATSGMDRRTSHDELGPRAIAILLVLLAVLGAGASTHARVGYDWAALLRAAGSRQDPESLLMQATAYLNLGRVVQAVTIIDELGRMGGREMVPPVLASCAERLRTDPADLPALYCLAAGHFTLQETGPALAHLRRVIELDPSNPWPLVLMSLAQLSGGDEAGARASAERALAVDRGNQYAHLILSQIDLRQHNYWGFVVHYLAAPDASREMLDYLRRKQEASR